MLVRDQFFLSLLIVLNKFAEPVGVVDGSLNDRNLPVS